MSNELTTSENPGAAGAGSATGEGVATGTEQAGFASLPAGAGRRALIEQIMKSDIDRYYSEGLDRELAQILEGDQAEVNPDSVNPTQPMEADQSRISLCSSVAGRQLVSDWDSMGGFRVHLANVQRDVSGIVRTLGGNREQRVFMEHFDREVPETARLSVYAEIATGSPGYTAPAAPAEVKAFEATPAGGALVAEWGSDAAQNVAMLRARAKRMTDAMDDDDAHEFWFWLDSQDAGTARAIFRKMAR